MRYTRAERLKNEGLYIFLAKYFNHQLTIHGFNSYHGKAIVKGSFQCLYFMEKKKIERMLREEFKKVNGKNKIKPCKKGNKSVVWLCWFQGDDEMPEIVRSCVDSIKEHTDHPVKLITFDNIKNYVSIPSEIEERIKNRKINLAHVSDYLRYSLLEKYGGLWLDATCFVFADIPEKIFESDLYYPKGVEDFVFKQQGVYQFPWLDEYASYCVASKPHGEFASFMQESMKKIILNGNDSIDYLFPNVIAKIAREKVGIIRNQHELIEKNNTHAELMTANPSVKVNDPTYLKMLANSDKNWFLKLSTNVTSRGWSTVEEGIFRDVVLRKCRE